MHQEVLEGKNPLLGGVFLELFHTAIFSSASGEMSPFDLWLLTGLGLSSQ
jgi:hypothetical protein